MNILTMNVLQETAGLLPGTAKDQVGGAQETASFANVLTQRQAAAVQHLNNLVGVTAENSASGADSRLDKVIDLAAIDTVAGLLQRMMALLQQQADPVQTKTGAGDWLVSMPDSGLLEQLGAAAGMTSEQLSKFMQPFINNKEKVNLSQMLDALASHFAELAKGQAITVPDTDLPLFQSLLNRMGIDVPTLDSMAAQVVTQGDGLDLSRLQAALKDLPSTDASLAVPLSPLDLEQLQAVLQRAGVPADKLPALLAMADDQSSQSTQSTPSTAGDQSGANLSVQSLQDMLGQAIQEIRAARPQVDPTAFLQRLEEVFTQAGFKEQGVGWTPVVQNSIENIYQQLLAIVDPAKVQVSKGQPAASPAIPVNGTLDSSKPGQSDDRVVQLASATEKNAETPAADASPVEELVPAGLESKPEKPVATLDNEQQPAVMAANLGKETVMAQDGIKEPAPLPRTAPALAQQTMEQLSQGVLHGARNNQHSLVLKLFPEDLGEVKVVLHVRNEQVSVSFTMPNTQVKEILEQNMQQFRDNLQKHGFVLEQCSASLDSHDKGSNGQHGFDLAMRPPWEGGRGSVAELPEDVLYRQAAAPARAGGIDLFL